ncbi:MAG TPA: c-type cytochrome [Polyangiaceae bacterium]
MRALEPKSIGFASLCSSLLFACGGNPAQPPAANASSGVASGAAKCDAAAPISFGAAHDVVAKRCVSCHSPKGEAGSGYDWTNDRALIAHRKNVAAEVAEGGMPPAGSPQLTPEEIHALVCWGQRD